MPLHTSYHIKKITYFASVVLLVLTVCTTSLVTPLSKVSASSTGGFNPGRIIDDAVFTNSASMSANDIQSFLNAQLPNCDTNGTVLKSYYYNSGTGRVNNSSDSYVTTSRAVYGQRYDSYYGTTIAAAPYVCLKNFIENPSTGQTNLQNPSASISGGQSAGQIIYKAAQANSINPQVILTTLQKEQGLVTDDWPWTYEYTEAMGYNCPDTPQGCTGYSGFADQVNSAAAQYRNYLNNPNNFNYVTGNNTIYYAPLGSCSLSSVVNIQNQATAALYDYTPYQPDSNVLANTNALGSSAGPGGAVSGDNCGAYGNRNFWWYFNTWFGDSTLPYAFQTAGNPSIYMYVDGYKVVVPAMGILQDYGISPQSIVTLDQSTFNAIPAPGSGSGVSTNISYIIKSPSDSDADGGTIYLVSIGKKYTFTSLQQFNDFGFSQSNISYVPLSFINAIPGGQSLTNFVQAPNSSVFKVLGGQKQLILSYQTYRSLNPSDSYTPVSYFDVNLVPSGIPINNTPTLVQYRGSSGLYLLTNGTYYGVNTYDAYRCWGFDSTLSTPIYQPADNSYLSNISPSTNLSCLTTDTSGNTYLLGRSSKYSVPSAFGLNATPALSQDLTNLEANIPTNASSLKQYIKGSSSSAVWYLDSGGKRLIPTYSNYTLLHLDTSQLSVVDDSALSSINNTGIKLGDGQIVKSSSNPSVYAVSGNGLVQYSTSDNFLAYGNSWSSIETYPDSTLSANYPATSQSVGSYLVDKSSNNLYLVDMNGCYLLNNSQQTSYGQTSSGVAANQTYSSSIFPGLNLSSCKAASVYVKQPGQAAVYWLDGGVKHPISGWNTLVQQSGTTNPYIITISPANLGAFPTGSTL